MMADPVVVYQLSLRIGASYDATCGSLNACVGVELSRERTLDALLEVQPKADQEEDSR